MFSKEERETVCVYDELNNEWIIESNVRRHMTKLIKIFGEDGFDNVLKSEDGIIMQVIKRGVDPSQVSFRNKSQGRVMTDEQRQAAAERMRKIASNKSSEINSESI